MWPPYKTVADELTISDEEDVPHVADLSSVLTKTNVNWVSDLRKHLNTISKQASTLCKSQTKLYLCKHELSYLHIELNTLDNHAKTMLKDVENAKVKSSKLQIRVAKQEMVDKLHKIQNDALGCINELNDFQKKLPVM